MNDVISFVYIIIIFGIGLLITSNISKKRKSSFPFLLFFEHMFFSYVYFKYAQTTSADANMYFFQATIQTDWLDSFGTSTDFIIFITTFFVKYLQMSKLAVFFLFGLFGYLGFVYFIKMLPFAGKKMFGLELSFLVLLLPEFHFWTAALGKDSLMFMSLAFFFYSLQNLKSSVFLFLLSSLLIILIRPHMAFIIVTSIVIALFIKNPLKYKAKHIFIGFIALGIAIASVPYIIDFLNIDQLKMNDINERLEYYNDYGASRSDGSSSYIDVSNAILPIKMFAYLFMPLFFDAHSILQFIASLENLFILVIFIKWLKSINFKILKWYKVLSQNKKIMAIYVLIAWILLAASMYNLGLASRQKYMILPFIFLLITESYYRKLQIKMYYTNKARLKKSHFR